MFNKEVKITCDYSDVEKVIKEVYGHYYEIMPMEECGSSQYAAVYEVDVACKALDESEQPYISALRDGKPKQFCLRAIMKDLCFHGHLEAGSYIIDVSW